MSINNQNFYRFKEFQLNVAERRLVREETPVSLTPKVFDVLALLVERGGHLVEKEELLRSVWEDAFVEEANVARVIHSLRKTLGENAKNKFIETVPKKGYRFVAEVEKVNGFSAPAETNKGTQDAPAAFLYEDAPIVGLSGKEDLKAPEKQGTALGGKQNFAETAKPFRENSGKKTPARRENLLKNNSRLLFSGFGLILFLLPALVWLAGNFRAADNNAENKSIAVLPLKPIGGETRDPIYELGISESLILKLSSAKNLTVRPLNATRKYLELDQNPTAAGREQEVDFVLSSNYQIAGGKIRVTSQLINVKTGDTEEVFKSEKDSSNVFAMQDAVASDIGNTLLARFGVRENALTAKRGTSSEEAYRLYLQAAFIFDQWNKTEIGKAVEYLERAVELDANYAEAYAMLAYAYRFYSSKTVNSPREQYDKSKQALDKALALNENLAEARAVSGMLKSGYEGDFAGAEKEYKRAIELNPESSMARSLYAYHLIVPGRFREALAENEKAVEIDPGSHLHQINYGLILYYSHRFAEAEAHFRRLLEKDKNLVYAYFWIWLLCDLQNKEAEAYEWFMRHQTQIKAAPETIQKYQNVYQKAGWKAVMREIVRQDEEKLKTGENSGLSYEVACFSARLGNREKALEYLEKTYKEGASSIMFIKVDPYLASLHGDPRFEALVARVGLN